MTNPIDKTPRYVIEACEQLIATADRYQGMVPSILDRHSGELLLGLPPAIDGQRLQDRAPQGANLMHDIELLETLYLLAEAYGRKDCQEAADRYLHRFATHCTDTPTGLFPWGEHAYWHVLEDRIGNPRGLAGLETRDGAIHDHLRSAPTWLWQKLHQYNPGAVARFARGLDRHWQDGQPPTYSRHAYLERPDMRLNRHPVVSNDFPRHSGFYVHDIAFAWAQSGDDDLHQRLMTWTDYWWSKRTEENLCALQSHHDTPDRLAPSITQTLSLGISLLEASAVPGLTQQDEGRTAAMLHQRGAAYVRACCQHSHPTRQTFLTTVCDLPEQSLKHHLLPWGSRYGGGGTAVAGPARWMLQAYRELGDAMFLEWARDAAEWSLSHPLEVEEQIVARDVGDVLQLLLELAEATGEDQWLTHAEALIPQIVDIYCDAVLPRCASGLDWYEGQAGPGVLLQGMARCALTRQS